MTKSGELFFDVDARHVRQLGRELVANDTTALAELIKNAYDADATGVIVAFERAEYPGGTLEIVDDGVGMSLETVEDHWMTISTSAKETSPVSSRYKRPRVGHKGIGRFAAESLGERLILTSLPEGSESAVRVFFDWENDYQAGTSLADVPNRYEILKADGVKRGTSIKVEGLHSTWNEADIARLSRSILLLQPPFPIAQPEGADQMDPGFAVSLLVDGISSAEAISGLDEFYESATAVIEGTVAEDGTGVWSVKGLNVSLDDYADDMPRLVHCGPFHFRTLYFIYQRDVIGSISLKLAREMGRAYGGVRVYREGMRVMPYGEPGNDWLLLDERTRKRNILVPIGNNNFFGQVEISRLRNPDLIDTASREGLIQNPAFRELQHFVVSGLIWAADRVGAARKRKRRTGERKPPKTRSELLREAIAKVDEATKGEKSPSVAAVKEGVLAVLHEVLEDATAADRADTAREEELIDELQLLRILASLGTSIAVFSHEVTGVVNRARAAVTDLEDLVQENNDKANEAIDASREALDQLHELAHYIDGYASHVRVRQKVPQPLKTVLEEFNQAFRSTMKKRGIVLTEDIDPSHLRTMPMTRSEIHAVLFNLLTNAIKALDREGLESRRVHVSAKGIQEFAVIRFEDTGSGINDDIRGRIFDAFVTTSHPDESDLGAGTGLGLKIVKDIVEINKGSVKVIKPSEGFTTCFEVRLPRWVTGT